MKGTSQVNMGWLTTVKSVLMEMLDFNCLKDRKFCLILLSNFVAFLAHQTSFIHLPSIIVHQSSITPQTASLVISVIGVSNIFGRLGGGIITNLKILTPTFLTMLSFICSGICVLAYEFCTTEVAYIITGMFYGLAAGPYISIAPVLLIDLFGLEQLTPTFGLLTLIRAISNAIGPPLLGLLFKLTHQYSTVLGASFVLFTLGAFICGIVYIYVKGCDVRSCKTGK